ncbi:MAG TPA: dockerin type I domain-containing protein [Bryobacteraceae bacterium]|nr:dockerin type I domain-containing protein [Bryobacteraceae bacterium]
MAIWMAWRICDVGALEFGAVSPADVNGDGTVDRFDVARVDASFGKRSGQAGFDAKADVNGDQVVDVNDLAFVARQLPPAVSCH